MVRFTFENHYVIISPKINKFIIIVFINVGTLILRNSCLIERLHLDARCIMSGRDKWVETAWSLS